MDNINELKDLVLLLFIVLIIQSGLMVILYLSMCKRDEKNTKKLNNYQLHEKSINITIASLEAKLEHLYNLTGNIEEVIFTPKKYQELKRKINYNNIDKTLDIKILNKFKE